MNEDPGIDWIRKVRHEISARFDHDPKKMVKYYMELQEQYEDRLINTSDGMKVSNPEDVLNLASNVFEGLSEEDSAEVERIAVSRQSQWRYEGSSIIIRQVVALMHSLSEELQQKVLEYVQSLSLEDAEQPTLAQYDCEQNPINAREKFNQALSKVPDNPPISGDEM